VSGLVAGCDQIPLGTQTQSPSKADVKTIKDDSTVLASVNGLSITENMLDVYMKQRQLRRPSDAANQNRAAILDELINLELARQDAEKQGLDQDMELLMMIDHQSRGLIANTAIQSHLKANPVSDEDLQKIYAEKVPGGSEYKARHILVKEEDEAKKLIAELDKGADFSELAKEHSTGPSGKNGGDLGWFSAQQMVKPFSDAAAGMEKGTYSKEPVKTQFGWHIIMLDDVRESSPPPFEQVKPQIQAFAQQQLVQTYVTGLRQAATVEMKEPPAPAPAPAPAAAPEPAKSEPAEKTESTATESAPAQP
jgi:peptidyl-prolyl cis-trans isomerase C